MRPLLALFIVVVIDVLGFGIMVPLVPYMGVRFGASPMVITPILGAYSLCQFIAAPVWGRLSDRFGRRPILISSLCGAGFSYLLLGLAPNLWWLAISRALGGAMAGNISAALAYASDISKPEDRAKTLGAVGAAIGIGFMLGPAIGGTLAGNDARTANFLVPAVLSMCLAGVALLLVIFVLRESHGPEQRAMHAAQGRRSTPWSLLARLPGLRLITGAALLVTFSQSTMESIIAIWAMRRFSAGPESIGLGLFALAIVAVFMQGFGVRKLVPRFGEHRVALAGVLAYVAGLSIVAGAGSLSYAILGLMVIGLGAGAFNPTGSALASRESDATNRGAVMGTYQSSTSLARVFGPFTSGFIYAYLGPTAPFLVAGFVTLQAIWCLLGLKRLHATEAGAAA